MKHSSPLWVWFVSNLAPLFCPAFVSRKTRHWDSMNGWTGQFWERLHFEMNLSPESAKPCWLSPLRELSIQMSAPLLLWRPATAWSTLTTDLVARHICLPDVDTPLASRLASVGRLPKRPWPEERRLGEGARNKKNKKKLTSVSFAFTHTYTLEKHFYFLPPSVHGKFWKMNQ